MKRKYNPYFRDILFKKQTIINTLRKELDKQARAQNALS